jgi:hypothetical protein
VAVNRLSSTVFILFCIAGRPVHSVGQKPRVELDHIFIVVSPGAVAEAAALRSAGLTVSTRVAKHDGQGTASVAVFFENAYLELIWVDTTVSIDAQHAATAQRFRKASSWRTTRQSPFGLGLRRLPGDTAALPVPVQRETAAWLEPGTAYEILLQPADSLAADFFVVPAGRSLLSSLSWLREQRPELLQHAGGGRIVTLVRVHAPPHHEPAAFRVLRPRPAEIVNEMEPLVELHLDGAMKRSRVDLRPLLPLVIVR